MLSSLAIAVLAFACIFAGTLIGMLISRVLPAHHLSSESKDAVKQGLALIATLTALVLGLLVATTKGTYDSQSAAVNDLAANMTMLDLVLARYGPETKEIRQSLPSALQSLIEVLWPEGNSAANGNEMRSNWETIFDKVSALDAKTDTQRMLKSRAQDIMVSMAQTRQKLFTQQRTSIPLPFLIVLGFWLTILFACYGLISPQNLTVIVVLIICMISVSAALFLILEMDKPFEGIIRVPSAPMRGVMPRLGE